MSTTYLTKQEILKRLDEQTIYSHYWPEQIIPNKSIYRNPFRDDRNGSCFFSWYNDKFYFFDRTTHDCIDCFAYIMRKYGCSFYEALVKINNDFGLGFIYNMIKVRHMHIEIGKVANAKKRIVRTKPRTEFRINTRHWERKDDNYWRSFGIYRDTLNFYNVHPVHTAFVSGKDYWYPIYSVNNNDDPCYVYKFYQDGVISIKLYRPLAEDRIDKWRSNSSDVVIQGWDQLPEQGNTLIVASSLKDVMVLYEAGYNACAPQSEHIFLPDKKLEQVRSRFDNIYICYDNDDTGVMKALKFSDLHDIPYIIPPTYGKCKDVADIAAKYGNQVLKDTIKRMIESTKQRQIKIQYARR